MSRPAMLTEVKRQLDGRVERFACALVLRRAGLLVARFEHTRRRRVFGTLIPRGSVTHGFFWQRRPYVLYRIDGPDGALIGCRFDAVDAVRIADAAVAYLDLLLDVWAFPDGRLLVEDEEEVAEAASAGLLTPRQLRRIGRTKALLLRGHRRIAAEATAILRAN